MARGMAIPVRTNRRGGAFLIEASRYLRQVVFYGLTPNLNMNPFQAGGGVEIGISERVIFSNLTPVARSLARRGIGRFFARLRAEDIARLVPGAEGLSFEDADGELIANVRYLDLEADEENVVRTNMIGALGGTAPNNTNLSEG